SSTTGANTRSREFPKPGSCTPRPIDAEAIGSAVIVEREDITCPSGEARCAAWLSRPDSPAPVPLVVMAHGFSGTREVRLDAYAEGFCDAGLGVLVFDYRNFGASTGEPRQLLDVDAQHDDYRAAIVFARGGAWADPARIALLRTSISC